jgi:hypothetical protein
VQQARLPVPELELAQEQLQELGQGLEQPVQR